MKFRLFFRLSLLLIFSCTGKGSGNRDSSTYRPNQSRPPVELELESVTQTDHRDMGDSSREYYTFQFADDVDIDVILVVPHGEETYPLMLGLHGYTADFGIWLRRDSYSKVHMITENLLREGVGLLVFDLPYHGSRQVEGINREQAIFGPGRYSQFASQVVEEVDIIMTHFSQDIRFASTGRGIMGYSLGAALSFPIITATDHFELAAPFVPPVRLDSSNSWGTPLYHAPDVDIPVLLIGATEDPRITVGDTDLLHSAIHRRKVELRYYESGHSLPAAYTVEATQWILGKLN